MSENERRDREQRDADVDEAAPAGKPAKREPPETAHDPAPGIEHEPEPSSENLIPTKDRPGTL